MRAMREMGRTTVRLAAVLVPLALVTATAAEAQRRPARRQQPIEIRGQVPTPQVVTVRPREVPTYSRRVLVPGFYDHDFWAVILPGYQLVPQRLVTGNTRLDSLMTRLQADSAQRVDSLRARAAIGAGLLNPPRPRNWRGTTGVQMQVTPMTPGDSIRRMPSDTTRRVPGDTTRSSGGTPPASPQR